MFSCAAFIQSQLISSSNVFIVNYIIFNIWSWFLYLDLALSDNIDHSDISNEPAVYLK